MNGNSMGFIETIALTAAIEAADTAVKSANVRLLGYELAKGDGMTTVKIEGDVGAVKAAVKAAATAAAAVGSVVSTHVIARPARDLEKITHSPETVSLGRKKAAQALPAESPKVEELPKEKAPAPAPNPEPESEIQKAKASEPAVSAGIPEPEGEPKRPRTPRRNPGKNDGKLDLENNE